VIDSVWVLSSASPTRPVSNGRTDDVSLTGRCFICTWHIGLSARLLPHQRHWMQWHLKFDIVVVCLGFKCGQSSQHKLSLNHLMS
jgi:hypothetical protein